jgi:ATP-dependent protease ClpP protease subunit
MRLHLKGERKAEILIYEDIGESFFGGVTAKSFARELSALGELDEINVRISSVGGSSWDAMAIYNMLVRNPATVSVDIDGIAASAASLVAMAADPGKLRMAANADFMIHRAWAGEMGDRDAMERMAGRLEDLDAKQLDIFAKRATIDHAQLSALLDAETWFTAEEAKAIGLIDEITGALKIAAKFGENKFKQAPARVASRFTRKAKAMTPKELQAKIEEAVKVAVDPLKVEHTKSIEKLSADHKQQLDTIKAEHEAEITALKAGNPPKEKGEPTVDELLSAERTRVKELHALASNAGIKDQATIDRWVDKKLSTIEAKAEIGELAIKQGKLSKGDSSGDEGNKEKAAELGPRRISRAPEVARHLGYANGRRT